MEFKHIAIEDDGTVSVLWNMSMEEYKELVKDAETELKLEGEQKKIPKVTGERGFQTRDRDVVHRDAIEDDAYVKGIPEMAPENWNEDHRVKGDS